MKITVDIIGGGLAGSEAALYLSKKGIEVNLYEMRPLKTTPVHKTGFMAEFVCSNSLGSFSVDNASGLLKEEITRLGSTLIPLAKKFSVPAGGALAIDRELFAKNVTEMIEHDSNINLITTEIEKVNLEEDKITLIATGPLTSQALANNLLSYFDSEYLHFYDAVAPIVDFESIDMSIAYKMDRYGKTEIPSYINCPMTEDEYNVFYEYLINAERIELKDFEKDCKYFEGCMPIEVMAKRGKDTLCFGPMKPVGLPTPQTGKIPYAVVQLRQDNAIATLYNLVGFQTNLKWSSQKELLKLVPGLQNVNIVRYGVMHRNTYINSPLILKDTMEAKNFSGKFFAGQLTGVEGYTESIATGLFAAINIYNKLNNKSPLRLDDVTVLGALCKYITTADNNNFQPMNANWGIIKKIPEKIKDKKHKKELYAQRSLNYVDNLNIRSLF